MSRSASLAFFTALAASFLALACAGSPAQADFVFGLIGLN